VLDAGLKASVWAKISFDMYPVSSDHYYNQGIEKNQNGMGSNRPVLPRITGLIFYLVKVYDPGPDNFNSLPADSGDYIGIGLEIEQKRG
jgi:hypothetical protein